VFKDAPAIPTGLIAIAVGDPDFGNVTFVNAASGAQNVQAGKSYRVDAYVIQRSTVNAWNTAGGTDWISSGGYMARYFNDPKPPETNLTANETHAVMGVQLTKGGTIQNPPAVQYFGADLATLNPDLTSTGPAGAAIFKATGITTYSGTGGGVSTWETQQGGTAAGVIFVSRFHPN